MVEGGSIEGERGEITGLPFAMKTDGESVRFVRYYSINQIRNLEKEYYDRAMTTGYLGGKVNYLLEIIQLN